MNLKKCSSCYLDKEIIFFRVRRYRTGKEFFYSQCKECESQKTIVYNKKNIDRTKKYQAQWKKDHPDYKREYNSKNIEHIREYRRRYEKSPEVKIKRSISHHVRRVLKQNKTSKNGFSVLSYLPYKIDVLKAHLESQFESWMTWENWGIFSRKWNDNDSSTWTWQIDHVIPQSQFPYTSMEDENFKKCWALENLRPLSAKQNVIDGNRR